MGDFRVVIVDGGYDSYERERQPIARQVVDTTHRASELALGRRDRSLGDRLAVP